MCANIDVCVYVRTHTHTHTHTHIYIYIDNFFFKSQNLAKSLMKRELIPKNFFAFLILLWAVANHQTHTILPFQTLYLSPTSNNPIISPSTGSTTVVDRTGKMS